MKRIKNLRDLKKAADNKRSITSDAVCFSKRPIPAMVVMNFTGEVLWRLFTEGLYVYEKKPKPKKV